MEIILTGFEANHISAVERRLKDYPCNVTVMRANTIASQLRTGLNVFQTADAIACVYDPLLGVEQLIAARNLSADLSALPLTSAMYDGRTWSGVPFVDLPIRPLAFGGVGGTFSVLRSYDDGSFEEEIDSAYRTISNAVGAVFDTRCSGRFWIRHMALWIRRTVRE